MKVTLKVTPLPLRISTALSDISIAVGAISVTVTLQAALTPDPSFAVAVMVAVPALTAVIVPLLTAATLSSSDVQLRVLSVAFSGVTSAVSLYILPASSVNVLSESVIPFTDTLYSPPLVVSLMLPIAPLLYDVPPTVRVCPL